MLAFWRGWRWMLTLLTFAFSTHVLLDLCVLLVHFSSLSVFIPSSQILQLFVKLAFSAVETPRN